MKTNQALLGTKSPGDEIEIRDFERIKRVETTREGLFDGSAGLVVEESREVFLDAWSGKTPEGHPVHVAYRFGEVAVEVDLPTPTGGRRPLTVLRWKPRLALGLAVPTGRLAVVTDRLLREEQARLAEASAELAEIRALNDVKRQGLAEGELRWWLAERNRQFALLSGRGLAGGKLRFRLTEPEPRAKAAA
jgi:hypothetical protein